MYSDEAIHIYGELLKTASAVIEEQSIKDAGLRDLLQGAGRVARRAVGMEGLEQAGKNMLESNAQRLGKVVAGPAPGDLAVDRFARRAAKANVRHPNATFPASAPQGAAPAAAAATGQQRLLSPAQIAGGAAVGLGAGAAGYGLGKYRQAEADKTKRNLAFGAGAAAGLALPGMLRGAANMAQSASLAPQSMFGGY